MVQLTAFPILLVGSFLTATVSSFTTPSATFISRNYVSFQQKSTMGVPASFLASTMNDNNEEEPASTAEDAPASIATASPASMSTAAPAKTTTTPPTKKNSASPAVVSEEESSPDVPLNLPSPILLGSSMVLGIASTGSVFEIISKPNPEYGFAVTAGIAALGAPLSIFLFYAAIVKGIKETEEDDAKFRRGR